MTGAGLKPVPNPSALFLAERPDSVAGSAVLCCDRGLAAAARRGAGARQHQHLRQREAHRERHRRRTASSLLLAVLEKRAGLMMSGDDVFVNVAGGMTVDEPAADLAVVAALASSVRNRPVRGSTALFGEVGLAGEVRGATQAALRVREAAQLGFTRVILPPDSVAARRTSRPASRWSRSPASASRSTRCSGDAPCLPSTGGAPSSS